MIFRFSRHKNYYLKSKLYYKNLKNYYLKSKNPSTKIINFLIKKVKFTNKFFFLYIFNTPDCMLPKTQN